MIGDIASDGPSAPSRSAPGRPYPGRPSRLRSRLWWALAAVAAVVIALLLWRLLAPAKKPPPAPRAVPVGVVKVSQGEMQVDLTGLGTVTPTATITVQTQISGQLLSVNYKEGQYVKKGQLLAQIDPRPYEDTLALYEGAFAHDDGLLQQAKSDLARYLILNKQDAIAKQIVTDEQFLVRQDEGTVQEDKANIASTKLNLLYCRIISPVTGRVGLRLVDPGNYVQTATSTGLVVITELQPITVVFVLPEDKVDAVMTQMRINPNLPVMALDRTDSNPIAQGRLLAIDNTVDTTTGTVKLRASFPNEDLKLFPNEFVNASLGLKTLKNVVLVPVRALQYGAPGTFVYVVQPNGTVAVRVVTTGAAQGGMTEIVSGLRPGETVVVDGVDLLRPGAKVKIKSPGAKTSGHINNGPGAPPGEQPQNVPPESSRESTSSAQ